MILLSLTVNNERHITGVLHPGYADHRITDRP